jgi:hypothetical protein
MRVIFNVFHVSQLKKCLRVPEERVEARDIKLKSDLAYEEKPVQILDSKERVTRNCVIKFYELMWSNHGERMQLGKGRIIYERFTSLFMKNSRSFKSRDKISIRGRALTPQVLSLHVHLHCMSIIIIYLFINISGVSYVT